jgi:hypothetical protein
MKLTAACLLRVHKQVKQPFPQHTAHPMLRIHCRAQHVVYTGGPSWHATHFCLFAAGVYAGDRALRTATHMSSSCSVKMLHKPTAKVHSRHANQI